MDSSDRGRAATQNMENRSVCGAPRADFRAILVGLYTLVSLVACRERGEDPEPPFGVQQTQQALASGWTLLSGDDADLLDDIPDTQWWAYRIGPPPAQGASTKSLSPGHHYWVYIVPAESPRSEPPPIPQVLQSDSRSTPLVEAQAPIPAARLAPDRVFAWSVDAQTMVEVASEQTLAAGRRYWLHGSGRCHFHDTVLMDTMRIVGGCPDDAAEQAVKNLDTPVDVRATRPPRGMVGWSDERAAHLRWQAPKFLNSGRPIPSDTQVGYRVVRYPKAPSAADPNSPERNSVDLEEPAYDAILPDDRSYVYHVIAFYTNPEGQVLTSERSSRVTLKRKEPVIITPPGSFEPKSEVTGEGIHADHPAVVITETSGQALTHMAYVTQNAKHGDVLFYKRSSRLAKRGSWDPPQSIATSGATTRIRETAIDARGEKVVITWLEVEEDPLSSTSASSIYAVQSQDGGQSFESSATLLRYNADWKRNINVGLDKRGHTHFVWGENSRVFYVKDFHGPVENVFDQTKRRINDEVVSYRRLYEAKGCQDQRCDCTKPVEESYSLMSDPEPGQEEAFIKPYLTHQVRAYVQDPRLDIDDDRISIVAHQTRHYSSQPVRNADWSGAWGPYVAPPARSAGGFHFCPQLGSISRQRGFRQTWKKDIYGCAPVPQAHESDLYHRELSDPAFTEGFFAAQDFYSFDPARGHAQNWYYYLYDGTWDEADRIKIAQRPLDDGAWSTESLETRAIPKVVGSTVQVVHEPQRVETGWRRGAWIDNTLQKWRVRTIDRFESQGDEAISCGKTAPQGPGLAGPSRPQVQTMADGALVVVYEKGGPANPALGHPIHLSYSRDGGRYWSSPETIAHGHRPALAPWSTGEYAVTFFGATQNGTWAIQTVRGALGHVPSDITIVDTAHHNSEANRTAAVVVGSNGAGAKGGVRAVSHGSFLLVAWVEPKHGLETHRIVTSRTAATGARKTSLSWTAPEQIVAHRTTATLLECTDQYHMLSAACRTPTVHQPATGQRIQGSEAAHPQLSGGRTQEKSVTEAGHASIPPAEQASNFSFQPGAQQTVWAEFSEYGAPTSATLSALNLEEASVALALGESSALAPTALLSVDEPSMHGNLRRAIRLRDELYNPELGAQREYLADEQNEDSEYLAQFDRVWAYTQGITLAQFARQKDPRAEAVAEYLCQTALRGTDNEGRLVIHGWPFSWNTQADTWKDARWVTGANAWAIHGLGVFVTSHSSSPKAQELTECYLAALRGLEAHRHPSGLMTAGHTTLGLQHATRPEAMGLEEDDTIEWAYYDVLDAIGYDAFDDKKPPEVARCRRVNDTTCTPLEDRVLTADDFLTLQTSAPATNVVTEHNLDVLSVLNHALTHWRHISFGQSLEERVTRLEALTSWRNKLRDAIFEKLWDPKQKRVMTGGHFEGSSFVANEETAVDNCTWLSLSVNYDSLGATERDKLGACLQYTVATFVRELSFNERLYRGTYYFPNSFKDPYISQSNDNEKLYHLEATTGLILGIRKFADAHPEHPEVASLSHEADVLWAEMQRFVRDNGFPYSSRAIHNLMTTLPSSTAVIWYIDVYDDDADRRRSLDQPLKNYAQGVDDRSHAQDINDAWDSLVDRQYGQTSDNGLHPKLFHRRREDGLHDPVWGTFEGQLSKNLRVRRWTQSSGREELATSDIRTAPGAKTPPLTQIHSVPINSIEIAVYAFAYTQPPANSVLQTFNWMGALDETHYAIGGVVDVDGTHPGDRVMLSIVDRDNVEWFIDVVDFDPSTGAFLHTYKEGTPGYPVWPVYDLDRGWRVEDNRAIQIPQDSDHPGGSSVVFDDQLEVVALPIARVIRPGTEGAIATSAAFVPEIRSGLHIWVGRPGMWSFHHREGGIHRYELVDVSHTPAQVMGSVSEAEQPTGRFVSEPQSDAAPQKAEITVLEDQALGILAGLSRDTGAGSWRPLRGQVHQWTQGLLSTLEARKIDGETVLQFPFATWAADGNSVASYYQVSAQFLAIYALTEAHAQQSLLGAKASRDLVDTVRAIRKLYGVHPGDGRLVSGGGFPAQLAGEVDLPVNVTGGPSEGTHGSSFPTFPILSLQDHVLGWFAVRGLASLYFEDEATYSFLEQELNGLQTAIVDHFWDPSGFGGPIPYLWLHQDGQITLPPTTSSRGDVSSAAALYLLFTLESGNPALYDRTARSVEILLQSAPAHRPQPSTAALGTDLSDSPLFKALALRAAAAIDPRLLEWIWAEYPSLRESAGDHVQSMALQQIVEHPRHLFGVHQEPLFFAINPTFEGRYTGAFFIDIQARYGRHYADTLATLLMSDNRAYVFDRLLHRLVSLDAAFALYEALELPSEWPKVFADLPYEDRLLKTMSGLQDLCTEAPELLQWAENMEQMLGLPCHDAESLFEQALQRRLGGQNVEQLAMEIAHPHDGYDLLAWARRLYSTTGDAPSPRFSSADSGLPKGNPYGNLDHRGLTVSRSTFEFLETQVPEDQLLLSHTNPGSVSLQSSLRARWMGAVSATTRRRAHLRAPPVPRYEVEGIDILELDNPGSPDFWSRPALELRMLANEPIEHQVFAHDRAIAPNTGAILESVESKENIRQLRRLINEHLGGDLPALAKASALTMGQLHLVMRTGILTEEMLEKIGPALGLGDAALEETKALFVLTPSDSGFFVVPPQEAQPSDLFSRHLSFFMDGNAGAGLIQKHVLGEHQNGAAEGLAAAPEAAPVEALMRGPGLFRPKTGTQALKALTRHIDDLLLLPPELAVIMAGIPTALGYASSLALEVDPGLLSIFIGNKAPSADLWTFVGRVRAQDLLAPLGTYLRDEEDIRAQVPIFTASRFVNDPLEGPSISFDDDRIYHITLDWVGIDNTPLGSIGVLDFEDGALFEVHALNTEHPRSAIIDASVRSHLRWQRASKMAEVLPETVRNMFLFWVELSIRTEFTQNNAERIVLTPPQNESLSSRGRGWSYSVEPAGGRIPGIYANTPTQDDENTQEVPKAPAPASSEENSTTNPHTDEITTDETISDETSESCTITGDALGDRCLLKRFAAMYNLADRWTLLWELRLRGPTAVGDLANDLWGMVKTSRFLVELSGLGLTKHQVKGTHRIYHVDEAAFQRLAKALDGNPLLSGLANPVALRNAGARLGINNQVNFSSLNVEKWRLLDTLARHGPHTVNDLVSLMGWTKTKTSRLLTALDGAGLASMTKKKTQHIYTANRAAVFQVRHQMNLELLSLHPPNPGRLHQALDALYEQKGLDYRTLKNLDRLYLLLELERLGPTAVTDLKAPTGWHISKISRALGLLADADLVSYDSDGLIRRYRANKDALENIRQDSQLGGLWLYAVNTAALEDAVEALAAGDTGDKDYSVLKNFDRWFLLQELALYDPVGVTYFAEQIKWDLRKVSIELKTLRSAGLVTVEPKQQFRIHSADNSAIQTVRTAIHAHTLKMPNQAIETPPLAIKSEGSRPDANVVITANPTVGPSQPITNLELDLAKEFKRARIDVTAQGSQLEVRLGDKLPKHMERPNRLFSMTCWGIESTFKRTFSMDVHKNSAKTGPFWTLNSPFDVGTSGGPPVPTHCILWWVVEGQGTPNKMVAYSTFDISPRTLPETSITLDGSDLWVRIHLSAHRPVAPHLTTYEIDAYKRDPSKERWDQQLEQAYKNERQPDVRLSLVTRQVESIGGARIPWSESPGDWFFAVYLKTQNRRQLVGTAIRTLP